MRKFLGYLLILCLVPILAVLFFLGYQEWTKAKSIDKVLDNKISVDTIHLEQTSYITDKQDKIISEVTLTKNRKNLKDNEIPSFLKEIFVITEDRQFYHHGGIDAVAISRALLANSKSDSIEQGASTITQQLARNVYLTQEKTYNRKITELLYAYQLEQILSKQEILDLYINAIYFNNGVYGIEAASQFYFNKSASALSKAELAFLAAIPNNPEMYNPLKHFNATKTRQERILKEMVQENQLSEKEYAQLVQEKITLHIGSKIDLYPDYVTYVHQELRELVASSEGLQSKLESNNETTTKKSGATIGSKSNTTLKFWSYDPHGS